MQKLEMKFDPRTVRHLGLKMYSHLPAALSEIISNSYDAYAKKVGVILRENKGRPESIIIMDDGVGLSCLLYTSPSPRDLSTSRMPSSA